MSFWKSLKNIGKTVINGVSGFFTGQPIFQNSSNGFSMGSSNFDWVNSILNLGNMASPYLMAGYNAEKAIQANKEAQERQYKYNLQLQQNQQQWLENLSSTAHQREVKDLRSAGLNPLLSAGGSGASTPSSGMGQVGLTDDGQQMQARITSALQMKQLQMGEKQLNSEIAKRNAEIQNINSSTEINNLEKARKIIENLNLPTNFKKQFAKMESEIILNNVTSSARQTEARANMMNAIVNRNINAAKQAKGLQGYEVYKDNPKLMYILDKLLKD